MSDYSEKLQKNAELSWEIYRWTCIVFDLVTVPICFISLCTIVCIRKRRDVVIISIPLLFMLSSTFEFLSMFSEDMLYNFYVFLEQTAYLMAHWMFCLHYLKTRLILPIIFEEADLEFSIKGAEENLDTLNHKKMARISGQIGKRTSGPIDTLIQVDEHIESLKKDIQRIKQHIFELTVIIAILTTCLCAMIFTEN